MWIGLNPSTAGKPPDEDQSTRKIRGFSERFGYGRFDLFNLYTVVATDPGDMLVLPEKARTRPNNFSLIFTCAQRSDIIICAWGGHGKVRGDALIQSLRINGLGRKLRSLGLNANGTYPHPLMLSYNTQLRRI